MKMENQGIDVSEELGDRSKSTKRNTVISYLKQAVRDELKNHNMDEYDKRFMHHLSSIREILDEVNVLLSDIDRNKDELERIYADSVKPFLGIKNIIRVQNLRVREETDNLSLQRENTDRAHLIRTNSLAEIRNLESERLHHLSRSINNEVNEILSFNKSSRTPSMENDELFNVPHYEILQRLNFELERRKHLSDKLEETRQNKIKICQRIQKKREHVQNLHRLSETAANVMKPVTEYLGIEPVEKKQQEESYCLSAPLYLLHVQLKGLMEAQDKEMEISISKREPESLSGDLDNSENCFSKRDITDEEEDEVIKMKKRTLLMKHSSSLIMTIFSLDKVDDFKDTLSSISIEFSYLVNLNLITVKPAVNVSLKLLEPFMDSELLNAQMILDELLKDDDGDSLPNPANYYELDKYGSKFDRRELGIPYKWAQAMGGLYVPVSYQDRLAPEKMVQSNLNMIVKSIRHRLRSRVQLCIQLSHLNKLVIPNYADLMTFNKGITNSRLSAWKEDNNLTNDKFPSDRFPNKLEDSYKFRYNAIIENKTAFIYVRIGITKDYPVTPINYSICAKVNSTFFSRNNAYLMELERELNMYYGEHVDRLEIPSRLLASQLRLLLFQFDLFLEILFPKTFPKEKSFDVPFRGRQRRLPFKYIPLSRTLYKFVHR